MVVFFPYILRYVPLLSVSKRLPMVQCVFKIVLVCCHMLSIMLRSLSAYDHITPSLSHVLRYNNKTARTCGKCSTLFGKLTNNEEWLRSFRLQRNDNVVIIV